MIDYTAVIKRSYEMTLVGIDPGINPTFAFMRDGLVRFVDMRTSYRPDTLMGDTWGDCPTWVKDTYRLQRIERKTRRLLSVLRGPVGIGLESVAYNMRFGVTIMSQVQYTIISVFWDMLMSGSGRIAYAKLIPPATWKRLVCGSGRAKKPAAIPALLAGLPGVVGMDAHKGRFDRSDALAVLVTASIE